MAQAKRIYAVTSEDGNVLALVNAVHPAQAVGVVIRDKYAAKVATQAQLVDLLTKKGMTVQEVSDDATETPPDAP